jgi:hypothetical protein
MYEQAPEATHGFPGPLLLPPAVMALVQTAVFLTDFGAIRVRVWASQLESRPLFLLFIINFTMLNCCKPVGSMCRVPDRVPLIIRVAVSRNERVVRRRHAATLLDDTLAGH